MSALLTSTNGVWALSLVTIAVAAAVCVVVIALIFVRIARIALTQSEPHQVSEVIYSLAELAGQMARWSPRSRLDSGRRSTHKEAE